MCVTINGVSYAYNQTAISNTSKSVKSVSGDNDSQYLKPSVNCQSNSKIIKDLTKKVINSGTKKKVPDSKLTESKAKKIFNYVNKKKAYSFYYNSKLGAIGLSKASLGNCVDKASLLIAMLRSEKIPARYVHATVTMSKTKNKYGHVYVECKVNGVWRKLDPTHRTLNTFDKIGSWNKQKIIKRYSSIPF